MAQKPLKKLGKSLRVKANVANKHGKGGISKSGLATKAPKRAALKAAHAADRKLSNSINAGNEKMFSGAAQNAGGKLSVLKAPVMATAQERSVKKGPKMRPGK
ncbi:hypothetical protein H632_c491p0 [Helicosporidium sp. ATCC 50920]|nr:hypothetical protein H632_c491p0 [Helicosporidium sp. ATCC 50920]|eukprot:KDD75806.1 hypothetical protein H632_c491p0 [Helicosporidium sp. ATCC 50920]